MVDGLILTGKQRWLKKKVGADWDDLVQDARVRCLAQETEPFYVAYLSRAITNAAINFLRHQATIEMISISDREEKPISVEQLSYESTFETNYDIRKFMMSRWSASEQDVIFMYFTDQISVRVASEMLKKSRTQTHVWLTNVKKRFRKEMR